MSLSPLIHRLKTDPVSACVTGCTLLLIGAYFVMIHARAFREVHQVALPTAQKLPALERRLAILQEQVEAGEVQAQLKNGSAQEVIRTMVLSTSLDLSRVLQMFEVTRDSLQQKAQLRRMSAVRAGQPVLTTLSGSTEQVMATPFSFTVDLTAEGRAQFLTLLDLSGMVTVGDALSVSQVQELLLLTEDENAAALPSLEQFFSASLKQYGRDGDSIRRQLMRSFASEHFEQKFREILQASRLSLVEDLFQSPLGITLERSELWPLPFLTIDRLTIEEADGAWQTLTFEVSGYARVSR